MRSLSKNFSYSRSFVSEACSALLEIYLETFFSYSWRRSLLKQFAEWFVCVVSKSKLIYQKKKKRANVAKSKLARFVKWNKKFVKLKTNEQQIPFVRLIRVVCKYLHKIPFHKKLFCVSTAWSRIYFEIGIRAGASELLRMPKIGTAQRPLNCGNNKSIWMWFQYLMTIFRLSLDVWNFILINQIAAEVKFIQRKSFRQLEQLASVFVSGQRK